LSDIGILNSPGDIAFLLLLAAAPLVLAGLFGAYVGWRVGQPGSRRAVAMGAAAGVVAGLIAYAAIFIQRMG
jgi:hypothetical protein